MTLIHRRWLFVAVLSCTFCAFTPNLAQAAKTYQVTGNVIEVSDKMIVVEKPDKERWEIDRDADTKITGDLKVGAKVTIYYHMTANKVEVKGK